MAAVKTPEELEARQAEIRARLQEIDTEFRGQQFPDEARDEWNDLNDEHERNVELIAELRARLDRVASLAGDDTRTERPARPTPNGRGRVSRRIPDDPHDLAGYRSMARSLDDLPAMYRDGALEVLESSSFPHPDADKERTQEHVERLLRTADAGTGDLAFLMLATGSTQYQRAFGKSLLGQQLTSDEQRALSLTTTAGGFAVPYQLDPTIIPTSNGSVNPLRQISRVETITTNEWRGVSSAGITASYGAEGSEAGDNAPTLAQPTANVEKATAFVPYSIEVGQDWGSLQTEMAKLIQDAKDDLEATKFVHGDGHGDNEPEGLLVGATSVVTSSANTTFAIGDVYALIAALPPRFVPRARILGTKSYYHRVRQFDTSGGAGLWTTLGNGMPPDLVGYPAQELSTMSTSLASGSTVLTIGDFSHFLIVDRIGLTVEIIPHLFHTGNNRPSGSRGLYAYWRNTSEVLTSNAFRSLKIA